MMGRFTVWHAVLPILWTIWLVIWIVAARGTKATQRHEDIRTRLTHLIPLIAGGVVLAVPYILGPQFEQRFHTYTLNWFLAGAAMVAVGLGFSIAARYWIGGNWSSMVTLKHDHELIRRGPYAWVRHPIYSGILCALAGTAIAIGNWRALVGLALFIVALLRKVKIEERFMAEQFGEDYARYRSEVPALIPFIV